MPDSKPKPSKGGIVAVIFAAVAIAAPLTAHFEGLRTKPYADPGNGTATVCYGETEREMRTYTPDECAALLRARQAKDYAPKVLACVPGLADRREAFAASISLSYNIGVSAFCRSTIARRFNAGRWREGCDHFRDWKRAGGKVLRGLVRRREAERSLCLKSA